MSRKSTLPILYSRTLYRKGISIKGYKFKFVDPTYSPSFLSRSWVVPITKGLIALIRLSGKESNLTQPMDTTQYPFYRHLKRDAFTTSDTLSCRLSEAGYAISPHSLESFLILYLYYTKTGIKCQDNSYLFLFYFGHPVRISIDFVFDCGYGSIICLVCTVDGIQLFLKSDYLTTSLQVLFNCFTSHLKSLMSCMGIFPVVSGFISHLTLHSILYRSGIEMSRQK